MIESSPKQNIVFQWVSWHYFEVPKKLVLAFRNFLIFNFNFFSIKLLCKTLFSHWRRYRDSYGRGFDLKVYAQAFISNTISRTLGAIVRIATVIIGLVCEILIFLAGIIVFIVWIFFPLFLLILFISGLEILMG